jgi:hypothetical protein
MSRYRWLKPSKCLDTMIYFPSLVSENYEQLERMLYEAVKRGDVKVLLNDEIVPKEHIAIYLNLAAKAFPEDGPYTLAPDLGLNYDDLCAVFDRPNPDRRTRGRPRKERSGWSTDRQLAAEMHNMLAQPYPKVSSAAEAARLLVASRRVPGAGSEGSLAKRLERAFRKYYSSG